MPDTNFSGDYSSNSTKHRASFQNRDCLQELPFNFDKQNLHSEQLRCLFALKRIKRIHKNKLYNLILAALESNSAFLQLIKHYEYQAELDWVGVDQDCAFLLEENAHIIFRWDKDYPFLLKTLHSPPFILFAKGDISYLSRPQIAVVGSRNATPIGRELAYTFAQSLSELGFCISSGLAIGIDTAAHRGALSKKGGTIAVLGNGLDTIYPRSNRKVALEIMEQGVLMSEFPIGTPPVSSHFPKRNRIISGMSLGVLVVEASLRSGSLITAGYAAEQGREVFAIPGSLYNPLSKGCHYLIKQGAKLIETVQDIVEECKILLNLYKEQKVNYFHMPVSMQLERKTDQQNSHYNNVLAAIGYDNTNIETIIERSQLTASQVSIMLLELELSGDVIMVPGGYSRVRTNE